MLLAVQAVDPSPSPLVVTPGDPFSFDAVYSTDPSDPSLLGLGLRMHYDSSKVSLSQLTGVLAASFIAQQADRDDAADYDGDSTTDKYLLIAWTDFQNGSWPGSPSTTLFTAEFAALPLSAGTTNVNFTDQSTAVGWTFASTPLEIQFDFPPTADAGGPRSVDEGGSITLDASGTTDPEQDGASLLYEWDLDGDGVFGETGPDAERGDEAGISPTFSADGLDGPDTLAVTLRVTDSAGLSDEDVANIQILNVAPTIDAGPDAEVQQESALTGSGSFSDPGNDTWTATVDYGDGSGVQALMLAPDHTFQLSHVYTDFGQFTVTVTVEDDDGGIGIDTREVIVHPLVNLDVDGNGSSDALTDGVVVLRHLFTFSGPTLVDEALAPNATRNDPDEIAAFLDLGQDTMLDVDGNGAADALSDGVLILRYLFGFTGEALTSDAVALDATRTESAEIIAYLEQFDPDTYVAPSTPFAPLGISEQATSAPPAVQTPTAGASEPRHAAHAALFAERARDSDHIGDPATDEGLLAVARLRLYERRDEAANDSALDPAAVEDALLGGPVLDRIMGALVRNNTLRKHTLDGQWKDARLWPNEDDQTP